MNILRVTVAALLLSASFVVEAQTIPQSDLEKSVVQISLLKPDGTFVGLGTGFFVRDDGLVITAFHVYASAIQGIAESRGGTIMATRVSREVPGNLTYTSLQLVNADTAHDLALLKLTTLDTKSWDLVGGIHSLKLSTETNLKTGTNLTAVGYFGSDSLPLTLGAKLIGTAGAVIVPAAAGKPPVVAEEFLADLKAFPGQSGSPVLLDDGTVIGVVLAMVPVTVQFNPQQVPTGFNRLAKVEFLQTLVASAPK